MTANEMEAMFRLKFDGLYEFNAPDISQEMVSLWLTDAQERVVLRKYNPSAESSGFESNENTRRDLEQLIRHIRISYNDTNPMFIGGTSTGSKTIAISSSIGRFLAVGDYIYSGLVFFDGKAVIMEITDDNKIIVDRPASLSGGTVLFSAHPKRLVNSADSHLNSLSFRLPSNFMFSVEEAVMLYKNNSTTIKHSKETKVVPVTYDEYSANISNPYKKPYIDLVWRMDTSGRSMLNNNMRTELILPKNNILDYYRLVYIAKPPAIVCGSPQVNCILNDSVHGDIIDEAVVMASAALKQQDYQTNLNESNRS
jgi:hypothetical protein